MIDKKYIKLIETEYNCSFDMFLRAVLDCEDTAKRNIRGSLSEISFNDNYQASSKFLLERPVVQGVVDYNLRVIGNYNPVRLQLKNASMEKGEAKKTKGYHVVEVVRWLTSGKVPQTLYRADWFDILAVCMEPITGSWDTFMFAPVWALQRHKIHPDCIKSRQHIGKSPWWTTNIEEAIDWYLQENKYNHATAA